ncbi:MAG: hypothetical protein IJ247_04555 [Bacilli bacterium]|nr:hypothetical protein [Bacilli bacterium]
MTIKISELVIKSGSKDLGQEPITFNFYNGINELSFRKRVAFDVLSFGFEEIVSGSIDIGGTIINSETNSRANLFLMLINIKKVGKFFCLFPLGEDQETRKNDIINKISEHKFERVDTHDQKEAKLKSVINDLNSFGCLYVLINRNEYANKDNIDMLYDCFSGVLMPVLFLMPPVTSKKEIPQQPNKKGKEIETKAKYAAKSDNDAKYYQVQFTKANLSDIRSMYIFFLVFPLIFIVCLGVAVNSIESQNAVRAVITILISVLCLGMHLYNSSTIKHPSKDSMGQLILEFTSSAFSLVGCGLSCLVIFLLANSNILFAMESFDHVLIICIVVFSILCIILPFFAIHLRKVFAKIANMFKKKN